MAGLKMDLAWVDRRLAELAEQGRPGDEHTSAKLRERIKEMSGVLDDTIQIMRDTASDLRPGLLDDVGLEAALEWQCTRFESRTGIRCALVGSADDVWLDREESTALYRICQELLTNVLFHAQASAVRVSLHREQDRLVLEVSDDGRGITDEQAGSSESLGILGMRERALLLGGEFRIVGSGTAGTTATVRVPLARGK